MFEEMVNVIFMFTTCMVKAIQTVYKTKQKKDFYWKQKFNILQ